MKKEIVTEVVITASRYEVWNVLTGLENYSKWNPFIVSAAGKPEKGTQLQISIRPPGAGTMKIAPRVTDSKPGETFRWIGNLFLPGLFDGEHYFILEPVSEGKTKLIHGEKFSGILLPLLWKLLKDKTKKGFHEMNEALKIRCESF